MSSGMEALRRLDRVIDSIARAKRGGVRFPIGTEADLRAVRVELAALVAGFQLELPL